MEADIPSISEEKGSNARFVVNKDVLLNLTRLGQKVRPHNIITCLILITCQLSPGDLVSLVYLLCHTNYLSVYICVHCLDFVGRYGPSFNFIVQKTLYSKNTMCIDYTKWKYVDHIIVIC